MRRLNLASLALLAGTASGAHLTLSNFEDLVSSAPIQCLYAYNTPIRGCTPGDFARGSTCSEPCIEGLQAVQFTVRSLCANVNTAFNPLLKQIQAGNIVNVLCKTYTPHIRTSSEPISHPETTLMTSTTQAPPPSEASPKPPSTTSDASHETVTKPSTPTKAITSAVTSTTSESSVTSTKAPSSTSESTGMNTIAPTSQTTNDDQASSTSEEPSKPTRPLNSQPGSGGGSPFDFVAIGTAARFGLSGGCITVAIAITFTTLTLI
ncbi:hypothetical protein TARUN_675 [Trichoderma arundinaceum]|uniref:Uncharacterized protein n=1 Tax=Trichoderma arundinaceum TaxID=490622 RepID=A0A395NZI8_TRIAR|nr:hypothetical protein TARUN_675 [Trichoderma arundinaceum]